MSRLTKVLLALPLFAATMMASSGCGSAEAPPTKSVPTAKGPGPMDTVLFGLGSKDEGERLFGRECAFCHVGKTTGTMMLGRRLGKEQAELVMRTDLEPDYVKAVVRNGLMNMPAFSRVEVTDAELDRIAAYLSRKDRK